MNYINVNPKKMREFGTYASEFRNGVKEQCEALLKETNVLAASMNAEDMQTIRTMTAKIETIANSAGPLFDKLNGAIGIYADYVEKAQKIASGGGGASASSSSVNGKEKTSYCDDNGNIYRVDNNLLPNTEYDINGYHYTTDDQGRITSAEGKLHLKTRSSRLPIKDSIENIGKGDQLPGDDRGHLIGDQFDGSNGLENMIPQNSDVNQKDFRNFENELAGEVKNGNEVYYKIEPIYEGTSNRPDALIVSYSINGEEYIKFFPNNPKG